MKVILFFNNMEIFMKVTYWMGRESLVLFRKAVTMALLKRINSLMTATEPLLAAIWAQVIPFLLAVVINSGLYFINSLTTSG